MHTDRNKQLKTDTSAGASEIIGGIMLISIVVAAVAIIAVALFSQPMPSKIPSMKFMTSVNGSTLYIYHNGGDPMNVGTFNVLLNGVPASYSVSGGGSQWSLGKTLVVPITTVPQNVQIVYNTSSNGESVLLGSASANVVNTQIISANQAPYLDCSAVTNWACADQIPSAIISAEYAKNVTMSRITLMKYGQQNAVLYNGMAYHLNFTVTDSNSSMTFGSSTCAANSLTQVKLVPGDKVSVYFTGYPNSLTLYGSAPQIWELTAGLGSNVYVIFTFANGTVVSSSTITQRAICDTYIGQYSNLDSTLVLTTDNTAKITSLTVNSTVYLTGVSNTTVIQLNNFQPEPNGLFMISFVSSTGNAFYVVGWASSIQFNGVVQTGLGV
jgi:hypothetical protein